MRHLDALTRDCTQLTELGESVNLVYCMGVTDIV